MSEDESKRWWTVPQAAVWIRWRDAAAVTALGHDATLLAAREAHPGAAEAIACLVEGFKSASFEGEQPYPLVRAKGIPTNALERSSIPLAYWREGGNLQLTPNDLTKSLDVEAFRPWTGKVEWTSILVAAEDCQAWWPAPAAILTQPRFLQEAARELMPEPADHLPWLLTHPSVRVTGLNASGERVEIDHAVLLRGPMTVNVIAASPDGPKWHEVMLELRLHEEPRLVQPGLSASLMRRKGGSKPIDDTTTLKELHLEASTAGFTLRDAILKREASIEGKNAEAKVRRLTRKYTETFGTP